MSQVSVNVVNPAAGAAIPGMGRSNGPEMAQQDRQFQQGQAQQQGQFDARMGQENEQFGQQMGLSKEQLALQKQVTEHQRQMSLLEAAMAARHEQVESRRREITDRITNAAMANNTDELEKAYPELDQLQRDYEDTDHRLTKLSILDHLKSTLITGEQGKDGPQAPLIHQDIYDAMQLDLSSQHDREQQLIDGLNMAITSHTTEAKRAQKESLGSVESDLRENRPLSPDELESQGRLKTVPLSDYHPAQSAPTASAGTFTDDLVMRVAPQLGLSEGETAQFRSMMQALENAATFNALGGSETRNGAMKEAETYAQQLRDAGVETDKMGFVLNGLMKQGASGRLRLKGDAAAETMQKSAEKGSVVSVNPEADAAYFQKVEQMGALGLSLRSKEGPTLFRMGASIDKGADGKWVKTGVDNRQVMEEAIADFIDNGKFDKRAEYLSRLPPSARAKVEEALMARQKSYENQIRASGFDPDTIDPSAEVRSLQDKKLSLSQRRRQTEDALTLKGMKTASKARKQITDETSGVEDSLLTPLRNQLDGLLSSVEGVRQ
jgi:hypothetical protein